jgi:phosphoribosylformylglycinamidine synthase subunit PurS
MSTIRCGTGPGRCSCARNEQLGSGEPEMKARITITLKPGVLDPQGKAIAGALHALGFGQVGDVRQGKFIELDVAENDPKKAEAEIKRMCEQLLANTIIENYAYELEAA